MSSNDPAVSASVGFEGKDGIFAGASTSMSVRGGDVRINTATQYVGIAKKVEDTSVEVGLIHRSYDTLVDTGYTKDFFEAYVGVTRGPIKARFYLSPDYLRDGRNSYYIEVNATLLRRDKWVLDGHAGLSLIPHDIGDPRVGLRDYEDFRLQISRPIGKAFFAAGVASSNYPVYSSSGKARAFASVSYAF